jgi:O-acetyl-ADP-ribose deacetylase (regulator of RNase III)
MADEVKVKAATLRLMKGDITDIEVESFVYYARNDLVLGSGFGNAISMRGGPSIQEELEQHGTVETTRAVVTGAGEMKARHIVHAVGPKFQEQDLEAKMKSTIRNALAAAAETGIRQIAFPPMGAGFYGVPLALSAELTLGTLIDCLSNPKDTSIEDVIVCLLDNREYRVFREQLNALQKT